MKNIIKSILLLLCIWGLIPQSYALSTIQLKQWEGYKQRVDSFIHSYEKNKEVLELVQERLTKVTPQKDGSLGWILVEYIRQQVEESLENIIMQEQEEVPEEVIIPEETPEYSYDYPGFASNYNDRDKMLLAGETSEVYAGGVGALYEEADVETVVFYIDGANISDIQNSVQEAYLSVEGRKVGIAGYSDIQIISPTRASITFSTLDHFRVPDDGQVDFRLSLKTRNVGYEQVGKTMKDLIVSSVTFPKVIGVTSGRAVTNLTIVAFSAEYFTITPAQVSLSVVTTLTQGYQAEIALSSQVGNNTQDTSKSKPVVDLKTLNIQVSGNESNTATYTLYNVDDSSDSVIGVYNAGTVSFNLNVLQASHKSISHSGTENYRIGVSNISVGSTIFLTLERGALIYNVSGVTGATDIKNYTSESISLGSRKF